MLIVLIAIITKRRLKPLHNSGRGWDYGAEQVKRSLGPYKIQDVGLVGLLKPGLPGPDGVICGCGFDNYIPLPQTSIFHTCSVPAYELRGRVSNLQFNCES